MTPTRFDSPAGRWAALAAAAVVAACSGSSGATGGSGAAGPADSAASGGAGARTVAVRTQTVRPGPFVDRIRVTGTVKAERTVVIEAEESGPIREVLAEKGARLEAGDPIARIDDRELRAQVEEARAQARLAEEQWKRRKRLYEEQGAISKLDYLEVKYQAQQARARLERLEARLEDTIIRAPFAGVLDERYVEVGTSVSSGTRVALLVDLRPAEVEAGVPERYADDVSVGDSATVTIPSLGGEVYRGTLSYVGATVNPDSRTLPVEVRLPNPEGRMKPETVAEVSLVRKTWDEAITVPQDAVLRTGDGFAVYVVESGDEGPVARRQPVTLGPREGGDVLVERGLADSDRVVTVGQQQVADGDRVTVVTSGG